MEMCVLLVVDGLRVGAAGVGRLSSCLRSQSGLSSFSGLKPAGDQLTDIVEAL